MNVLTWSICQALCKTAFKVVLVTIFQLTAREGKGQDHQLYHLTKATNMSVRSWPFFNQGPTWFWTLNGRYLVCRDPRSFSYKNVTEPCGYLAWSKGNMAIICQVTNYYSLFPTWVCVGGSTFHPSIWFNWGTPLPTHGPLKMKGFVWFFNYNCLLLLIACYFCYSMKLTLTSAGTIQVMKVVSFLIIGKTLLLSRERGPGPLYNPHQQN